MTIRIIKGIKGKYLELPSGKKVSLDDEAKHIHVEKTATGRWTIKFESPNGGRFKYRTLTASPEGDVLTDIAHKGKNNRNGQNEFVLVAKVDGPFEKYLKEKYGS